VSADIVISIDFELRWGVHDAKGVDSYRRNLEGVREVVPRTLEVFRERGVRATWAIVGALACEGWDEWRARAPAWPRYLDRGLAWREEWVREDARLYFAPDLVEDVRRSPGQELGSHTFSHVYMGEPGFVRRDAVADAAAVTQLFRDKWQLAPRSFVFPRNQVGFADVLQAEGFAIWRTTPDAFYWSATSAGEQNGLTRLLRLADSLLPWTVHRRPRRAPDHASSYLVRFGLPPSAWRLHVRRLLGEAARLADGESLHLWWHPHNLGADVNGSVQRLTELLDRLRAEAPSYARFASMADVATACTAA
jgi:peptidoglycan/xylan/chitin deacetylase (PgdA/CDA1 family)